MELSKDNISKVPVVTTLYEVLPAPFVDDNGAGTKYVGYAPIGVSAAQEGWRLIKYTTVGTVTVAEYPKSSMDFKFVWDDRAGYTYSR